ncbi:acyltransferase [Pseudarthrobacter sp. fls2-241-R2A-168]|uniref:acyltransferase family protein n=1 Tax=Pseudarthrobacter sp. fls2-241-R2A-168 TaxID=3040304 RepID=UPI002553A3D6|nr:acyltransferase [Pseudarthrobacter sp. fls2-241-R2A-168]
MHTRSNHLSSLTGLRFFAALAVVTYHLRLYISPLGDSLTLFGYGFTGVSFFFVLSGFVLTWSGREDVRRGAFYWNRLARIWPLHIFTMMLAIWAPQLPTSSGSGWLAVPFVLSLTQAWIPASPFLNAFNGVSWSLSCEAFFYLTFPFLCKKVASAQWRARAFVTIPAVLLVLAGSLAAVSSVATADYLLGTMPLYRLGEFILGMCLAQLMKGGWRPPFHTWHATLLLVTLTVGLFVASLITNGLAGPVPVTIANLVMVPGFLALIATCADGDLSGKTGLLRSSVLVRLGQWSYALYLVHELVIRVARQYSASLSMGEGFVLAALVVLMSVSLSGLLHEFVEKPAERWLRQQYPSRKPQQVQHP